MKIHLSRTLFLLASVSAVASLLLPMSAARAEIREQSFKFASVQSAEHPFSQGAQKFAKAIAEKSG